jgi:hypothetical protein
MDHLFDEFSRSLAESLPRRESLRRLGAVFAGAVLSPLVLPTAWAGKVDPCAAFCKCRNKADQAKCLAACQKCNNDTSRIGGSCGSHVCCSIASCKGVCSNLRADPNCGACDNNCRAYGETCCGSYCADLATDVYNCGRCGTVCASPDAYEYVACVSGKCFYDCVEGADDCGDGTCTPLWGDPDNCGACGNVCGGATPYCSQGACTGCAPPGAICGGACVNLWRDSRNCGACGNVCPDGTACSFGACEAVCPGC